MLSMIDVRNETGPIFLVTKSSMSRTFRLFCKLSQGQLLRTGTSYEGFWYCQHLLDSFISSVHHSLFQTAVFTHKLSQVPALLALKNKWVREKWFNNKCWDLERSLAISRDLEKLRFVIDEYKGWVSACPVPVLRTVSGSLPVKTIRVGLRKYNCYFLLFLLSFL